jgi:hypothetical protein
MAKYQISSPDGQKFEINAPDGATQEQVLAYAQSQFKAQPKQTTQQTPVTQANQNSGGFIDGVKNFGYGALKGASDIGATILQPVDYALNKTGISDMTNDERRASLKSYFNENADTDSLAFQGGELTAGIAGTAGVGGALAKPIGMVAPKLANAVASGGFNLGQTGGGALSNAATRLAGGAISGGASSALIDPNTAGTGAMIGAAIPAVGKLAGASGRFINKTIAPFTEKGKNQIIADFLLSKSGNNADDVIRNLEFARGNTAGFNPTTGQASNVADLATLERTMKAKNPSLFQDIDQTQRTALANAIRGIGGDDAARAGLANARTDAVDNLYTQAESTNLIADDVFNELMQRPAVQDAFAAAATNTANKGGKLVKGKTINLPALAGERIDDIPESAFYKEYPGEKLAGGQGRTLLAEINRMGGIKLNEIRDILGEKTGKAAKAQVGLFRKEGKGIDDLATQLSAKGYIPADEMDFDGGVRYLRDAIRNSSDGNKMYALDDMPVFSKTTGELQDSLAGAENPSYFSEMVDGNNVYSGKVINEARKALNAQKNFKPSSSAEAARIEGVRAASDAFNSYINNAIPSMGQANSVFSELSKPINQMDLGNEIISKYIPASMRDMPSPLQLNREQLAKILRDNGDKLAANTTGFKGSTLENTLSPNQLATIENAVRDGQFMSQGELLGKGGGSDTFQKLAFNGDMNNAGIISKMTNFAPLSASLSFLKGARDLAYTGANKEMESKLAEALLNPQQAAQLMKLRKAGGSKNLALAKQLLQQATVKALPVMAAQ